MNALIPTLTACPLASTLVTEAALGWILLDLQERVVLWNPWMERASGIPERQILGQSLQSLFPTLRDSRLERAIGEALRRGLPALLSSRLNTPPALPLKNSVNRLMHQSIQVKPVEPAGMGRHCFIQIQDVTHMHLREQHLRETTRAIKDAKLMTESINRDQTLFLANLGHALRTPLSAILGMAELLKSTDDLHKARRQAAVIHDSGEALREILEEMLDYARIESGELTLSSTPWMPETLMLELCESIATMARTREIDFLSETVGELPPRLLGDPLRLRQALSHLLIHLLRSTSRGEIHLKHRMLTLDERQARLSWEMHAPSTRAIPLPMADDATRPFSPESGSGLGPAIAQGMITRLGGTLESLSLPKRGLMYRVEIPFALPSDPPRGASLLDETDSFPRQVRILVVEDDEVNREVTCGQLKRIGIQPDLAGNGAEALQRLSNNRYDLVFMDCQMPVMDGWTASRRFRASEDSLQEHTPIVALTAYALKGDRERCLEAGMDDYLAKPVRREILKKTIQRWVKW